MGKIRKLLSKIKIGHFRRNYCFNTGKTLPLLQNGLKEKTTKKKLQTHANSYQRFPFNYYKGYT